MGWKDLDGDDAVQARVPRGTLLPCLQRRAAPRFRTGRGECQRSVPQWRGLYLLKPSVGITLVFATEGRIPPLKRLFIKEAGVAIANGLKAVNPGCYLAWSFRRLCPNYGLLFHNPIREDLPTIRGRSRALLLFGSVARLIPRIRRRTPGAAAPSHP